MKGGIHIRELLDRYRGDYQERTAMVNAVSLAVNAVIGAGKLILGVYLLSGWLITNAIYYLILSAARGQALHKFAAVKQIEQPGERLQLEHNIYRRSGLSLCLLGISYLLVSLRMYVLGDALIFSGNLVYLVAAVSFTKLGMAIYGMTANRNLKGPIVSTLKIFSFTDALVSIVVTQYTLLTMQHSPRALDSSALLGMGFSLFFVCIGMYMACTKKAREK
ncbi:hypothetical protein [Paenibacillus sp. FSL E2-0178]|uniref:hypothetical protein n=1 Tax=Paenibacillus sp. FSL E2-0178 TaxID=2921361 RepID=UPI0031590DE4